MDGDEVRTEPPWPPLVPRVDAAGVGLAVAVILEAMGTVVEGLK